MTKLDCQLSVMDAKAIRWYFTEGQSVFERSTMGGMLDRGALYGNRKVGETMDGQVIHERIPLPRDMDPRKRSARHASEPWDPNPITAQPTAETRPPGGHMASLYAYETFAAVSRRLLRLQGVTVGSPPVPVALVLELHEGPLGASYGAASSAFRIRALSHLTASGSVVVIEALARARDVRARIRAQGLKPTEADFVLGLNFDRDGPPDRFAAIRAGYPEEGAAEAARKLRDDPKIQKAIELRKEADRTLCLRPHEVFDNAVSEARTQEKKHGRATVLRARAAEREAKELFEAACRAWNAAGKVER